MDTELAWAAGLWDGEGSTSPAGRKRKDGNRPSIRMAVSQKDTGPELLIRFQKAVGVGKVNERRDRPGVWVWTCQGFNCQIALKQLWPYLSTPKKKQANKVLSAIKESRATSKRKYNWDAKAKRE